MEDQEPPKSNGHHQVDLNLEEIQAQINEVSSLFRLGSAAEIVKETAAKQIREFHD